MKDLTISSQLGLITSFRDIETIHTNLLPLLGQIFNQHEIKILRLSECENKYTISGHAINDSGGMVKYSEEGKAGALPSDSLYPELQMAIRRNHGHCSPDIYLEDSSYTLIYQLGTASMESCHVLVTGTELPKPRKMELAKMILAVTSNYCDLLIDSQTDTLTGLLNRKILDESISKILYKISHTAAAEFVRESRTPRLPDWDFWLAVVDIDHFKRVNDTFGHCYGDEVLLLLSQLMRRSFRDVDLLFRYGGEEFIIIIGSPDKRSTYVTFERFRQEVANFKVPQVGQVTVSLGVVQIANEFVSADLVGFADRALYHAKQHGRNQVCFYEDLLVEGEIQAPTQQGTIDLFLSRSPWDAHPSIAQRAMAIMA